MCPISVGYLIPWGSGFKMEVTSQPGLFVILVAIVTCISLSHW